METQQREHIRKSISELIHFTVCSTKLLEELHSRNILDSEELEALNSIRDESLQARKFYEVLQTRIQHYDTVKTLLLEANQTGAFTILDKYQMPNSHSILASDTISYSENALIGTGVHGGNVFQGKFGTRAAAIKKLVFDDENQLEKALTQIDLLMKLDSHPNIVSYYGTETGEGCILIAMELCDESLQEWSTTPKDSNEVFTVLHQTTEGIAYLHSQGITHGCLHPGSVLLTRSGENVVGVKIAFGRSMLMAEVKSRRGGWSAPEVIREYKEASEMGFKADIFSLGCIFYFVLTNGGHPFGQEESRRMSNIADGELVLEENNITSISSGALDFIWLIRHMISHNEHERPTASTVLCHPAFWSIEKKFQFFLDISQYICKFSTVLDMSAGLVAGEVMDQGWLTTTCTVVPKELEQNKNLEGTKFSTLIKAMIQLMESDPLPEDVRNAVQGDDPIGIFQYWRSRYPFTLPTVWTVFQKLEQTDITQKYYKLEENFEFSLVGKLDNVVVTFPVPNLNIFIKEEKVPEELLIPKPRVTQAEPGSEESNGSSEQLRRESTETPPKPKPRVARVTPSTITKEEDRSIDQQENTKDEGNDKVPYAQAISGTKRHSARPSTRVPLSIPCTGRNCNSTQEYNWICKTCSESIEYGFDHFVYCDCGKTTVSLLEFKCTDPKHGSEFEFHNDEYILHLINQIKPFPELNILILGETGVGKSTWINGFINFLKYESLQEAEAEELCTLVPSQFTLCDNEFEEITVTTGSDPNEGMQPGQAATQEARVYPFTFDKLTVRLIDTPGIGDPRGIEQDQENFQNILSTISQLKEIHGICILLKPNNSRLTVMFRFCLKGLLTYLHRDASKNIVFCFTNSRGTLYRPGDTLPALRALLKENKDVEIPLSQETVYCFDSEAYRFLAAVKNTPPVSFIKRDRENFGLSWDISIAETKRMLEHIQGLTPHPIQSTLNLNHARELVLKMTRPLAEISRNIQRNKLIVEDEKREIESMKENIEELKKKQMTSQTEIEMRRLDYPKTVCGNSRCVRIWTLDDNMKTIEYGTVCHEKCTQTGVRADTIGDIKLLNCMKFKLITGKCKHCGHSYREHLHVYYDSIQVLRQVENQVVKESLAKNLSAAEMKQKMIVEKNMLITEYKNELKEIEKASVTFAYFLKANAITPYNDGMEMYLDHLIKEEEGKVAVGGNDKTLSSLRQSKESYLYEKAILETQMKKGEGSKPETGEVDSLVRKLQGLKHSGKLLIEALDYVNYAGNQVYIEEVEKPVQKKLNRGNNVERIRHFFESSLKLKIP